MASQTQADPLKPGYWLDLRSPLPKPGDFTPPPGYRGSLNPPPAVAGTTDEIAQLAAKIAHAVGLRDLEPFIKHVFELEQRIATLEQLVGSAEFNEAHKS